MTSVRKFLFNESFDTDGHAGHSYDDYDGDEAGDDGANAPPAVFGDADVMAARQAGYVEGEIAGREAGYGSGFADGHAAGHAEGVTAGRIDMEATSEARIAGALERIGAGVDQLIAERHATNAARLDQPVHLALAIVRKLMPDLARRGGLTEIETVVQTCLAELIDEPRLVVRVAGDTLGDVRDHLNEIVAARGFGTKLVVLADPALGPGDCRVEWAEGGIERDTRRLLADIEQCAARLLSVPASA